MDISDSDAIVHYDAFYGAGTGPVYLGGLRCSGTESKLTDCQHGGMNYCGHSDDAGLRCCK